MRVEVPLGLFESLPGEAGRKLMRLIDDVRESAAHRIILADDYAETPRDDRTRPKLLSEWMLGQGRTTQEITELLGTFGRWEREELDQAFTPTQRNTQPQRNTLRVRSANGLDSKGWPEFPIEAGISEAIHLLRIPFRIWFEHANNDGEFFRCMLRATDPGRADMCAWLVKQGAVEFRHGGGLPQLTEVMLGDLKDHPERAIRTWAVFDSDRGCPDDPPAKFSLELCEKASERGIGFWCLERRAIENYLPDAALVHRLGGRRDHPRFLAYQQLPIAHRKFVNFKKGIRHDRDNNDSLTLAAKTFWNAVDDSIVEAMGKGFGQHIAEQCYGEWSKGHPWLPDQDAIDEAKDAFTALLGAI